VWEGDGRRRAERRLDRRRKTTSGGPSWAERPDNLGQKGKFWEKEKKMGRQGILGRIAFGLRREKEKDFWILIQGMIFKFKF
jgi:hypothetical protein